MTSRAVSRLRVIDHAQWSRAANVPPVAEQKRVTTDWVRLRAMVKDREKAAWLGLGLAALTQAIVFAAWLGRTGERIDVVTAQITELRTEQQRQSNLVYSLPYMQSSITEIKSDMKELKGLVEVSLRKRENP